MSNIETLTQLGFLVEPDLVYKHMSWVSFQFENKGFRVRIINDDPRLMFNIMTQFYQFGYQDGSEQSNSQLSELMKAIDHMTI